MQGRKFRTYVKNLLPRKSSKPFRKSRWDSGQIRKSIFRSRGGILFRKCFPRIAIGISFFILFLSNVVLQNAHSEISFNSFISAEGVKFKNDDTALTEDQIASLIPGYNFEYSSEYFLIRSKLAYRYDFFDSNRDFFYIGENLLKFQDSSSTNILSLGFQRIQIGSLDFFQSQDVLNDGIGDNFSPEIQKQGYPIISYRGTFETFKIEFFHLPYFYAPYYPDNSSRLGYGIEFDNDYAVRTSGEVKKEGLEMNQFGGKIDIYSSFIDLTLGYFHFIDRGLSLTLTDQNNQLNRYFFETNYYFMHFQYANEDFLLKGQYYFKDYQNIQVKVQDITSGEPLFVGPKNHSMMGLGFESKIPFFENHDLTFLTEYQKLLGVNEILARRYSIFSNDLAWGFRWQLNDIKSKQFSFMHIVDLDNSQEQIYQLDYRQNITDNSKINFGLRIIEASNDSDSFSFDNLTGLAIVDDADSVYMTITFNF